jgi:ABC-2 type transport system ATP-binding protein
MNIIEVKGVSKSFKKNVIFSDANFKIKKGEILGILGSSGSGKSVLIKCLMGFIKPSKGKIINSAEIGFSTQANAIYENLTVKQNLNYFARLSNVKDRKKQIEVLLKNLSLTEYEKVKVLKLSGGTKKRVDLACALLTNPEILILDEPFAGLDTFLVNQLSKFLKELKKQGKTIIISSHLLDQVENLCTDLIFIKDKKVVSISKSQLKKLY